MERLRRVLDASWRRIGGVLGRLGASWGVLGRLGSVLGASWGRLGGVLEASWRQRPEKANIKPKSSRFTSVS